MEGQGGLENIALSTRIVSTQGCTNICKQAFEFAKKTGRKRVTLVEKPNVLRETGGLMMRCFKEVAKSYPDIRADDANIDAICMWMFKNPQDYSVLVAENMFGDIVSDLCAGLVGGLGFAPAQTSATNTLSSNRPTDQRRNTPVNTRSTRWRCS